ncbi:hypothetical protein [Cytobacillus praedii]|uniref:hypothetical protein n=1 Tax=Cytobacillus praedii TaxID=1742358 RepID=UPI002E1AC960|nr:hypothetical protein [Cytobacillus praedii]
MVQLYFKPTIIPTVIIGEGSCHIPQNKLLGVSKLVSAFDLVTIEDARHHVHEDNLPALLAAVTSFLDS